MKKATTTILLLLTFGACYNAYEISFVGEIGFDMDKAILESKTNNKPLLLYFTAHGCQNCRRIEAKINANRAVRKLIKEKYNFAVLYTDDLSKIENVEGRRNYNGKIIETNMDLNVDYQIRLLKAGSQPILAILEENKPTDRMIGYTEDITELIDFLK